MPYPELVETERLVLRRWRAGDLDAYEAIWADPGVSASLLGGLEPDRDRVVERFRHQLEHWRTHGFGWWLVIDRASGEKIGWLGAWFPDFIPELVGEIEIGWTLRQAFWGCGLATEGARAAVAAAFEHLEPERVISIIAPSNTRSVAVASRLGMSRWRAVRHPELGRDLDVYALSVPSAPGSSSSFGASPHSASSR
jgi:RimJ/RimL family protein N-acetyltransferase